MSVNILDLSCFHGRSALRSSHHHEVVLPLLELVLVHSQVAQASEVSILRRLTALNDADLLQLVLIEYSLTFLKLQHRGNIGSEARVLFALRQRD